MMLTKSYWDQASIKDTKNPNSDSKNTSDSSYTEDTNISFQYDGIKWYITMLLLQASLAEITYWLF